MKTGVCYYPEHWPTEQWAHDATHMRRIGLSYVRIGEFAWSRLEDADGQRHFEWLSEALDVLHAHDLKVILGTPTATPPRWMIDKYPDMLALDEHLQVRNFGSRRHYCFSHAGYIAECRRIVKHLAEAYGNHPAIVAWQTDNEYGCHSTSISYSSHALAAFRQWCARKYASIEALNTAWGNVFWSMEYDHFEHIGLPVGNVTESNPAHQLDYWRFSSDQIRHFNKVQVDIIRPLAPGRDVVHNFMGNFVEFDHHLVAQDLDVATWDNYPLGFLTRDSQSDDDKQRYLRTGHPDSSAFHHDLYRGCCNGRWWVMEQQPGPVNWAPYNPSPLPGMARLWGWEAFAHGAEVMSYFRWRQAPFAQEQTHTGLLLSNGEEDTAAAEVAQLNQELQQLAPFDDNSRVTSDVAIVFSYEGVAMQDIQRPGGETFSALDFCQRLYGACRQLGLNVDVISSAARLDSYKLVLICNSTVDDASFTQRIAKCLDNDSGPTVVFFPGSASRTDNYAIVDALPPGNMQSLIDITVVRSESLPPEHIEIATNDSGLDCACQQWREQIKSDIEPTMRFSDGWGFHYSAAKVHYINALPKRRDLIKLIAQIATQAQLKTHDLGPDVRTQQYGQHRLAFNFGKIAVDLAEHAGAALQISTSTNFIVGQNLLEPAGVAIWKVK